MSVGELVRVKVIVGVAVKVGVIVGVRVGVKVRVGVGVKLGVKVRVGVNVDVRVGVNVGVNVAVGPPLVMLRRLLPVAHCASGLQTWMFLSPVEAPTVLRLRVTEVGLL